MKSASAIVPLSRSPLARRAEEVEFLPAALEILETPPSPIGRAIIGTIIAVFCVAVLWACLGWVDVVATAQGKIIPSGRTKVVQPFETGVVRAIHVRDGQEVKAGDLLIELDPTINTADLTRLKNDLVAAELEAARLRAALSERDDPQEEFRPPAGADPALVATQRQFLLDQVTEYRSKLAALDRQKTQREAESATSAATIAKSEGLIPLLQQQVDIRQTLFEREIGSRLAYLQTMLQLVEQQKELGVQKSKHDEAEAAVAAIIQTRAQAKAEFRRTRFDELTKAETKAAGLRQEVVKAQEKTNLQRLTAPVDGVVQQLAVHTVGGVVTPAQSLLVLVPAERRLEIEAMVNNDDVGFIHAGQPAEIKLSTFNFTRYGLLHGEVLSISPDAVTPEQTQQKDQNRSDQIAPPPKSQGQSLAFAARVSLDRDKMQIDDRSVDLTPGMMATVEIKTGSRRVISFLLSPFMRYQSEALRER